MKLTPALLQAAVGCAADLAQRFAPYLDAACAHFRIDSQARMAAFLAQIGHESGSLRWVREVATGDAYEGRRDLGNTQPGDGRRYRGRGLLQITGRDNYRQTAQRMMPLDAPDFEDFPDALEEPRWAAWSAADWWDSRQLNGLADVGEFDQITRRINGGTNGQADRRARWERAIAALAVHATAATDQPAAADPGKPATYPASEWDMNNPAPTSNASEDHVRSSSLNEHEKGAPMAPFIATALTAVLNAAPELIDMFRGDSKSATRNSEAAKVAVGVAKQALGAVNEQDLVERLAIDPAARETVRAAVKEHWFEIHKAAEKSVADAREFATLNSANKDVRTVFFRFTFVEFLSLVFIGLCTIALGLAATFGKVTQTTLDNILLLAGVASIVGIREFWFGSSFGSRLKDEKADSAAP